MKKTGKKENRNVLKIKNKNAGEKKKSGLVHVRDYWRKHASK